MPSATAALQFLRAFMAADVAHIQGPKSPLEKTLKRRGWTILII
jgi:hypothetical protein